MRRYRNQALSTNGFSIRSAAGMIRNEVEAGTIGTSF